MSKPATPASTPNCDVKKNRAKMATALVTAPVAIEPTAQLNSCFVVIFTDDDDDATLKFIGLHLEA